MQAEEQVKLAYMAVKAQIIAETVADANYDATTEENTTKLGKIVEDDLTGEGWNIDYSIAGKIFITYNNSRIMADTIEKGKPSKNGQADFAVFLQKQEAILKIEGFLPKEFQQVEYIESTGTQYIDTGFKPNQDTSVEVKYCFLRNDIASFLYGSRITNVNSTFGGVLGRLNEGNRTLRIDYNTKMLLIPNDGYNINTIYTLNHTKNKCFINGIYQDEHSYKKFSVPYNMYIFAMNTSESVSSPGYERIYYLKIWDNEELIRSFISCKSTTTVTDVDGIQCPSGTIGLYDTLEGKFYTNQGTGEFIAGADV